MFSVSQEWQMNARQAAVFNRHVRYLDSKYTRTRGSGTSKEWYAHGGWRNMDWFVRQQIVSSDRDPSLSHEGPAGSSGQGRIYPST
jgi:hypothetical protein